MPKTTCFGTNVPSSDSFVTPKVHKLNTCFQTETRVGLEL